MRRSIIRSLAGMLLALGGAALASGAAHPAYAATNWQVKVGGESADHALQAQAFLPAKLTINEGDTVTWAHNAFVHTVTFLSGADAPLPIVPEGNHFISNPVVDTPAGGPTYDGAGYANSGLMPAAATSFALTFTKAGTYSYVCLLHPGMVGEIVVQPAGSAYPLTQAQVDAQANAELYARLAHANGLLESAKLTSQPNPDGTTSYTVVNGIGGDQASVQRFLPVQVRVKAGDSVSWPVQDPHEVHTVTFYDPAGPVPPFVVPQPQPGGPPQLLVPHAAPQGGTRVEKPGLYNSGILRPGQSYTFTFPTPGVYPYVCVLHANEGMFGEVVVEPAGAATRPASLPETGGNAEGGSLPLFLAFAGASALGLGLLARIARMRRRLRHD